MAIALYANNAQTTVTAGGATTPASGTQETWTLASAAPFPAVTTAAGTHFHAADTVLPSETIDVINISGTTATVIRGAEGTTPVAHAASFTLKQVVSAGDYAALRQLVMPSGDVTGAKDTANINASIQATNGVHLGPGVFYIGAAGSSSTAVTLGAGANTGPYGGTIRGSGRGLTLINQLNHGIGISSHGTNAAYPSNIPAAQISDFTLDGTSAGNNAVGIDYGDGSDYHVERVRVSNFTGTGAIGMREINQNGWTEKAVVQVETYNCTTHFVFDVTVGPGQQSHMYGSHRIHMNMQPGNKGCVFKNGAFLRNNVLFELSGNYYPDNSGDVSSIWLDVSGNDGAGNYCFISQTHLHIKCECTGTGTSYIMAVKLGTNIGSAQNRMLNNHGGIAITGGNWLFDPAFAAAGVGSGAWTFSGMINEPSNYNASVNTSGAPNKALSAFNAAANGVSPQQAPVNCQPTNPAATASLTLVMMGLGAAGSQPCLYTPKSSGLVHAVVTGVGWTNTAAVALSVGCRYGTGTPPAFGAAVTGTRFGAAGDPTIQAPTTTARDFFSFNDVLALTAGTAYWFDLAAGTSVGADTAQVSNVSMSFIELS